MLKNLLRRLFPTDDEPKDSDELKAREEILEWQKKRLRMKIAKYRVSGGIEHMTYKKEVSYPWE